MADRWTLHFMADVAELLRKHGYGDIVGNGQRCVSCGAYGWGTCEPHLPACKGVELLQDAESFSTRSRREES